MSQAPHGFAAESAGDADHGADQKRHLGLLAVSALHELRTAAEERRMQGEEEEEE